MRTEGEHHSQAAKAPASARRSCDACGTDIRGDVAAECEQWEDACFCADCWRTLPEDEIKRVAREIALRGVPLS